MTITRLDFRRGLFRLWLVLSVLFAGAVIFVGYGAVALEFEKQRQIGAFAGDETLVPTSCAGARGTLDKDFSRIEGGNDPPDTCWYDLKVYRRFYPEFATETDAQVEHRLYEALQMPLAPEPTPWLTLLTVLGVAFGGPLLVLVVGAAIYWAVTGFKPRPT
jgi:hypothetical protein